MRIEVYEILATNSLSGSRIIINDNFKMLEEGLNSLYNNIDIDAEGKMTIANIEDISAKNIEATAFLKVTKLVDNDGNPWAEIKKVGDYSHLFLLDENGSLSLDVNTLLQNVNALIN